MKKDGLVAWEDRYSMGIISIDEQHKKLFEMTNSLYDACLRGEETARRYFKEVIHDAVKYVQFHFTTEERLMERLKFSGLAEHKAEHTDFVKKVLEEVQNFEGGKNFVPNMFVRFLREWIVHHIAITDTKYADYIRILKKQGTLSMYFKSPSQASPMVVK
ncbi:MAG: bacteriohemerythrin [Treponema sp.]|jgi:hemerythrin|nr:bacteriohemerythrin [Treponema sp.]